LAGLYGLATGSTTLINVHIVVATKLGSDKASSIRCLSSDNKYYLSLVSIYYHFVVSLSNRNLPKRDNIIRRHAPSWSTIRIPIFVTVIVWTFLVKILDPAPRDKQHTRKTF